MALRQPKEKQLKDRWHVYQKCGTIAQCDMFSAFLAKHVTNDILDNGHIAEAWPVQKTAPRMGNIAIAAQNSKWPIFPASLDPAEINSTSHR